MRRRDDAGSTTAEVVVVVPVFMVLLLAVIQLALWADANSVAQRAAAQGDAAARAYGSSSQAGYAEANSVLQGPGRGLLSATTVSVDRELTGVNVSVDGQAVSILPGFTFSVHAHSIGPLETFRGFQ